jgi:hypothetical protein
MLITLKYMFMFRDQNTGRGQNLKSVYNSFESVEEFN